MSDRFKSSSEIASDIKFSKFGISAATNPNNDEAMYN